MKAHPAVGTVSFCIFITCSAFAQAKFDLRNYWPPLVDAPVFDAAGVPLVGTAYLAELWGGVDSNSLLPLVLIDLGNTREIVPFVTRGYFLPTSSSDNLCVSTAPTSGWAWLQVRAWDASLGATYEEVVPLGMGGYGESTLFYAQGSDPFAEPPRLPAPLIGLESFSLRAVPEPSAWALLALGGFAAGCALRRKRAASERRQGSFR